MFLHEHWLYEGEFDKLAKIGGGLGMVATSVIVEHIECKGHPFGGCAIQAKIQKLSINNNRLCGIIMFLNDMSYLFLNAYMPYDRNTEDPDNIAVIDSVKELILNHNPVHIVFGGNLNTDCVRISPHALELNQCVEDCDFNVCIDSPIPDVPYTFINSNGAKSRIDHFLVSDHLSECVSECCNIDNHLFSDHVPLKLTLDVNIEHTYTNNERPFNV